MIEYTRSCSVQLSHKTFWCLLLLARAQNQAKGEMSTNVTADSIAEKLLSGALATSSPDLVALYAERQGIEEKAIELLKGKHGSN